MRVDRFLAEEHPEFEPDDAQMHLELYRNARSGRGLRPLRGAARDQYRVAARPARGGRQAQGACISEAGEITLAQMLHEWALHDLGHIRQIAELVRARKYLAGAGPLGKSYQLKP